MSDDSTRDCPDCGYPELTCPDCRVCVCACTCPPIPIMRRHLWTTIVNVKDCYL